MPIKSHPGQLKVRAMSDEGEDGAENEEGEGEAEKKGGKKKLILIAGLSLLLLIGIGVGATLMLGIFDEPPPPPEEEVVEEKVELSVGNTFMEIPDLIVNLNSKGRKAAFLKIKISLEIENAEDMDEINQVMPRIIDNFQVYLRELRIADLQGSSGLYRLREELLRRVNLAVRPVRVKDILFNEMLVQ
ncbi:flagellar basal body-associated FliL family protein [Alphaproteobacteria bacterium]|mgnify:CR=1 FL=1|nr:flagellar basal body-associated FliL family protein [Alphaproteobacteria bacterium]